MKASFYIALLFIFSLSSCFKELDTEPIPAKVDQSFVVVEPMNKVQSFFRFYENTVVNVGTANPSDWDIAFESSNEGSRVLPGWASASTVINTGYYDINEITEQFLLDLINNSDEWTFTDPSYVNSIDSISLKDWENGEVYLQSRGVEKDNYYVIQFVSKDEESYTFRYVSGQSLSDIKEYTISRTSAFNYQYFSYNTNNIVNIEPARQEWDIVFTPYLGWWETTTSGEYAPYNQSGILINNEFGVRIAHVFDTLSFSSIDSTYIHNPDYEFTDMKGAIGSNWKLLGAIGSADLYKMDPMKKYLLKKYDYESDKVMYFKLRIVDYQLNGEWHHPTVEFKYLGSE